MAVRADARGRRRDASRRLIPLRRPLAKAAQRRIIWAQGSGEIIVKYLVLSLVVLATGATSAAAESWHPFSRSPNNVFMADVDSIVTTGDITSVRVATAPRRGTAGDYSHSVETYELQCASDKWRTAGVVEYGPDGVETDRYPEENAAWEEVRPNTSPDFLNNIACEGARAQPPVWATIKAFVDAGRP
jgi:hypothetical protein